MEFDKLRKMEEYNSECARELARKWN